MCAASLLPSAAYAAQEIRFWHAMNGAAGAELEGLVARFNASQREFKIVPAYKGSYESTLAAALAARNSASGPDIVQVYEAGTADVMSVKNAVRPLWQVMHEAGVSTETKYVPAVADYYSDTHGRLLALPFNASTPVLFYNRDAFRKAKLDPSNPPKTWYEMPNALGALREAGVSCPFTTAFPSWVLLENMSAWHNQEFATHHNGMDSANARLDFNGRLMMRWISMLESWLKSGYFVYAGRENQAEAKFASGECAVLTSSSASYADLRKNAKFDVGVAQLPYYDDFAGSPQNTLVNGAGLWVMGGKPSAHYRGAAKFLAWLAKPEVAAEWAEKTGYLPVSTAAYDIGRKSGFYKEYPGQAIAMRELTLKSPTPDSRGIRLAQMPRIRGIIDEELEAVFRGVKTPLDALNSAVKRGNALLERFARNEPEKTRTAKAKHASAK